MNKIDATLMIDCYGCLQIWRGHHDLYRPHLAGNIYLTRDTGQGSDMLIQNSQDQLDIVAQLSEDERNDLEAGWVVKAELYEEEIPMDTGGCYVSN